MALKGGNGLKRSILYLFSFLKTYRRSRGNRAVSAFLTGLYRIGDILSSPVDASSPVCG